MRILTSLLIVAAAMVATADAQRRFRTGVTYHSFAMDEGAGSTHRHAGYGATAALLTTDDAEMAFAVTRFDDLSGDACVRQLTFYGVDSYYYPVGARGIAPFTSVQVGLGNVTESQVPLLFACSASTPIATTTEIGIGYGLGVRVGGRDAAAIVEARFFQVPNSFIQGLELSANASVTFGAPRESEMLRGSFGPTASYMFPLGGPLETRAPLLGVRFRRDTKKAGTIGLQIDYAPFEITTGCSTRCEPDAILFAPDYQASVHPRWGRPFAGIGLLLAGFWEDGPDRGMAQGIQGGVGADIYSGASLMWTVTARGLWLQRNSGENVFGLQIGVTLGPRLVHHMAGAAPADSVP